MFKIHTSRDHASVYSSPKFNQIIGSFCCIAHCPQCLWCIKQIPPLTTLWVKYLGSAHLSGSADLGLVWLFLVGFLHALAVSWRWLGKYLLPSQGPLSSKKLGQTSLPGTEQISFSLVALGLFIRIRLHIYIYVSTYMCMCVYACVCVYMCMCMYVKRI